MKKILISGVFDLLHSSHILMFRSVKMFGDYLVVNIIPDNRVREKKGEGRPIQSELEREFVIKHLITLVDETTCIEAKKDQTQDEYEETLLRQIAPSVFIRGKPSTYIEKFCKKHHIRFIVFPEVNGIDKMHTTDIINKIKKSCK